MFRDYIGGTEGADDASLTAAAHIDVLTFCRIRDFTALTEHQQKIILDVHEKLTAWESENSDLLDSPFSSYSVNGVSMSLDGKLVTVGGVCVPASLYSLLRLTGLCYPAI